MAIDERKRARTQALCWLLDELFDTEEDLLAALDRGAIGGWRRERVGEFCGRVGEGLVRPWGRGPLKPPRLV